MEKTRYVTNENGERVGVILSIEQYERLRGEGCWARWLGVGKAYNSLAWA